MRKLLSPPTTFTLHKDVVEDLKQTARTLLYENADFQRLIDDQGAAYPEKSEPEEASPWWKNAYPLGRIVQEGRSERCH